MDHFKTEKLKLLVEEIDLAASFQNDTHRILTDLLLAAEGLDQPKHHEVFLKLFEKIRINLESALVLLPRLKEDYRSKTSVNLLYRSIIDDRER